MNNKYKLLDNENVYDICEHINLAMNLNDNNFEDAYLLKNDMEEVSIRNSCFTYKKLFFAEMEKQKITSLCIIDVSQYPSNIRALSLNFLSKIKNDTFELVEFSFRKSIELFEEYNKAYIYTEDSQLPILESIISKLDFSKDLILKDELKKDKNVYVYSKFLNKEN